MAWAIIIIGLAMLILAVRPGDDLYTAAQTIGNDIGGSQGFGKWIIAIAVIGAIGYVPDMKGISDIFLVLCLISFLLSNNGVFAKAESALS